MAFVDIVIPCLTALFADDLCLHSILNPPPTTTSSYTFDVGKCILYSESVGNNCKSDQGNKIASSSFEVRPVFVYSIQCRMAVIGKFIPNILLSCTYNTFIIPLLYGLITRNMKVLSQEIKIWHISLGKNGDWVLPDVTYSMISICEDFALLLFYGTISPFCAIALALSIVSRALLLRWSIYRYYCLQPEFIENEKDHIESVCYTAQKHVHIYMWQGLVTACYLYGFYLFEMAYDTEDNTLLAPVVIFLLLVFCVQSIRLLFFRSRKRVIAEARQKSMSESFSTCSTGSRETSTKNPLTEMVCSPSLNPKREEALPGALSAGTATPVQLVAGFIIQQKASVDEPTRVALGNC